MTDGRWFMHRGDTALGSPDIEQVLQSRSESGISMMAAVGTSPKWDLMFEHDRFSARSGPDGLIANGKNVGNI